MKDKDIKHHDHDHIDHEHDHKHEHCNHDHPDHDEHQHSSSCGHNHSHGSVPIVLFVTGLALFLIALFIPNEIIQNILFTVSLFMSGYHIIGEGFMDTIRDSAKKKKFSPNVHLLMTLAAIGALFIGDFQEGALLIVIFAGAHFLEEYAEGRSRREITNLLNLNPTEARLMSDDGIVTVVSAKSLKIGDRLQVLNGDQIPTDGQILVGSSSIDESSITGESIPSDKGPGDPVFGSTINGNNAFTMVVTKNPDETVFAKVLQLVNEAQSSLSKTATRIKKVEPIYVTIVLLLVPVFILFGNYVMNWGWNESFYRGMVFLTVTSPCALAASDVPATLSAISNLARSGVLFKGGSYLSNLAEIKVVAFDKTGTLTEGKPSVTDVYYHPSINESSIKEVNSILVAMEKQANHPLATAIVKHFSDVNDVQLDVENHIGSGLTAIYNDVTYRIGKPNSFMIDDASFKTISEQYFSEGKTVVYFGNEKELIAAIAIMDLPHSFAKDVIDYLNNESIHTVMITGDAVKTGNAVGKQIGIAEIIGDVHPEDKADIIKSQQAKYGLTAMVGDGVNDAPALAVADIGFAMGQGTDIAIDVADAVLMKNDLRKFVTAHKLSKRLRNVVWQNIIFSMFVVVFLVILNILGQMSLPLGVIFHEGSTLVVIANGLRLLRRSK